MSLDRDWARERQRWEAAGLARTLSPADRAAPQRDLVTNDYLGLSRHPEVVAAARDALDRHGAGGRASRLLGGGTELAARAERAAADWLGAEAALLFASGYHANVGLVPLVARAGDALFSDARNHASLIDGARLSRARVEVYAHADPGDLERRLTSRAARAARRRFVVTESVFSMDGDLAPLVELQALCRAHDAWLLVDEAHAAGLLGPQGAGGWRATCLDDERLAARVVTGSKALGLSGAFAAGSRELIARLSNRARTFVYTTAPAPSVAAGLAAAIAVVRADGELRQRPVHLARALAERLGLPRPAAAIVPVVLGSEAAAQAAAEELRAAGYDARAVRPPTVPPGTSRVRVVLHAAQTHEDIERIAARLAPHRPAPAPGADPPAPRPWVVCGTDTGIGKTVVAAALLVAARRRGPATYWKPVQTGSDSDTATVAELAGIARHELPEPGYAFPLPASPHEAAAAAGGEIDPAVLTQRLNEHARAAGGPLVAELAGGLFVPLAGAFTELDWLARVRPRVVLVARSGLGTLNHTLLSIEALGTRGLVPEALVLVGPPHASNRETLAGLAGVPRILELPPLEPLDAAALGAWVDQQEEILAELLGARP